MFLTAHVHADPPARRGRREEPARRRAASARRWRWRSTSGSSSTTSRAWTSSRRAPTSRPTARSPISSGRGARRHGSRARRQPYQFKEMQDLLKTDAGLTGPGPGLPVRRQARPRAPRRGRLPQRPGLPEPPDPLRHQQPHPPRHLPGAQEPVEAGPEHRRPDPGRRGQDLLPARLRQGLRDRHRRLVRRLPRRLDLHRQVHVDQPAERLGLGEQGLRRPLRRAPPASPTSRSAPTCSPRPST